ncbi:hypothetical protein Asp14428_03060 [Actinoplanes sp. NBRC 14428]|nr:hypothetical protein Asp14428_03060 [Actinoplanes sp. NBRC 14428]
MSCEPSHTGRLQSRTPLNFEEPEFLTDKGVDTSDFAAKVNFRQYNNTTIGGSAYGPVATGTGASATMSAAAAALTGGRKKGNGS